MTPLYKSTLIGCALLVMGSVRGEEISVPVATDLRVEARRAQAKQLPILLTFSARYCDYCEQLEEDFLEPMLRSGHYRDRIIIRKLHLDDGSQVIDFSGRKLAARELSFRYRVFVTPTILFLNAAGREVAERMVGINTPEMYGGYLDECIDTALHVVRKPGEPVERGGCLLQPRHSLVH
jgi:thioredoxin-related protein